MEETLSNEPLRPLIFAIRGHRAVLDADLARLYGVNTKRFNEAFKRNRHRFPADFAFQLRGQPVAICDRFQSPPQRVFPALGVH